MSNNKNRILFSHEQKTKVGIGTDTPSALLHLVTGETHATIPMIQMDAPDPKIVFNDSTNTGSMMIKWQAAPGDKEGLRFFRDANDAEGDPDFMIDLAGDCLLANNVGIGTTSPDYKLDISTNKTHGLRLINHDSAQANESNDPPAILFQGKGWDTDVGSRVYSARIRVNSNYSGAADRGNTHPVMNFDLETNEHDPDDTLSTKMVINADGNVGIGTASPSSKLDVDGTIKSTGLNIKKSSTTAYAGSIQSLNSVLTLQNTLDTDGELQSVGLQFALKTNGNGFTRQSWIGSVQDNPNQRYSSLIFGTDEGTSAQPNRTEKMRIHYNGNVGIGTTTPESKLTILNNGSASVDAITLNFEHLTSSGGVEQRIKWRFGDDATADAITDAAYIAAGKQGAWTTGANRNSFLSFATTYGGNTIQYGGTEPNYSAVERMRITSTGNVGIGTTSPEHKLQIDGGTVYATTRSVVDNLSWDIGVAGSTASNADLRGKFYMWDATNNQTRFVIDSDGNVGIGTTDPGAAFHVNKSSTGDNQALLISNYDKTVGTGQSTRLLFGLARNSGTIKPTAGKIFVGRSSDWTADDSKLNSFMRFSIMDGMNDKDQLNISTGGADFRGYVGTDEIRCKSALLGGARNGIKINVGESDVWEANNLGHEWLYVNAEEGIQVNTSPDNWASAWAGRDTTTISGTEIKINNKEVWHEGNIGNDVGLMRRFKHQKTLTKATETRVLRITGTSYASAIKIHMWGTTGNVVVNTLAEILANHALSVNMSTSTGGYTGVTWRVVSSDDKFDLYVTYGTAGSNQGNSLPAKFSVNVYGDENVYWSPTDTAHVPYVVNSSGTNEHTHNTGTNTIHHTARGDVDLRVGGSIVGDSIRTYGHNVDGGATEMILDGQFGNKLFFHRSFGIAHTGTSNTFTKYFNFCLQSTGGCYYKVTMLSQRYNDSGSGTGNRFYGCIVDEGFLSWESDGDYGTNHESKLTSNLGGLSVVSKSCFLADSTTATATTPDNNNYGNCIVRYGVQFNGVIDTTNSGQMVYVNVELTTVHGNNTITSPHFLNT